MENGLDEISRGETDSTPFIKISIMVERDL